MSEMFPFLKRGKSHRFTADSMLVWGERLKIGGESDVERHHPLEEYRCVPKYRDPTTDRALESVRATTGQIDGFARDIYDSVSELLVDSLDYISSLYREVNFPLSFGKNYGGQICLGRNLHAEVHDDEDLAGTLSMGVVVDGMFRVDPSTTSASHGVYEKPPEDIEQYLVMPQQGIAMRLYDNDLIVWDSEYAHSISEPLLEGLPITSRSCEDTRNEHIPPAEGKVLRLRGGGTVQATRSFAAVYHKRRTRNAYARAHQAGAQVPRRDQNRANKNNAAHNRRAKRRAAAVGASCSGVTNVEVLAMESYLLIEEAEGGGRPKNSWAGVAAARRDATSAPGCSSCLLQLHLLNLITSSLITHPPPSLLPTHH
ncbi:hypothetical protein CYMTET_5037 [Cymbomonas tetramitiformis]|uniref:Uncharacterized protein n=1 Tax=Cymbomonas tetramitiformis TaxID=36881 RepID=A0AAE0H071_9CHLO|nr:hypothetical protein CYMTET_5037 [Cymbomonas tetramitiformis]